MLESEPQCVLRQAMHACAQHVSLHGAIESAVSTIVVLM